jgi:DNA polymerase V
MGFAAPADDELADTITVGRYLLRDKDASYLLQMTGDAMQAEGILDGDMIVFERSHDYRAGDIVVALGDDGYALKYFNKTTSAQIIGVVTGSFRKYK